MDEMVIRTKFIQKILASKIGSIVEKNLGFTPDISFNDPIKLTVDETGKTNLHLNIDISCAEDMFDSLLKKI